MPISQPSSAGAWSVIASGTFSNNSSVTLINDANLATSYMAVKLLANWCGDTAADTVLLRANNISTGSYNMRYWSTTTAAAWTATNTGWGLGNSAVAAGGSGGSADVTVYLRRVSSAGGVNVASIEGSAHDRTNYTNAIISGDVALAADVTRLDLVMPGSGKLQTGQYRLLALA